MAIKTLEVGINLYELANANLSGCVQDTIDNWNWNKANLNLDDSALTTLTDADATKANWVDALKTIISRAVSGDILLLNWSCHGTTATAMGDFSGDYTDALCPHDTNLDATNPADQNLLTNVEIHQILSTVAPGVIIDITSDSCHSSNQIDARDMLWPQHKSRLFPGSPVRHQNQKRVFPFTSRSIGNASGLPNVGFRSGCGLNETSADAFINGKHCGAFTNYKLQAQSALWKHSNQFDMQNSTVSLLVGHGYQQHGSADGGRTMKMFAQF